MEREREKDLEALYASGLIDGNGNMAALDVREDGASVELAALAERITSGEETGEITVNGSVAAPDQILKIQQVSAAVEVAQLLEEENDVTDEHVENLKSLLTGIQSGRVGLESALKTGSLSVMKSRTRLRGASGQLSETINKSDLPTDSVYGLPDTALDTLSLLDRTEDGTGYKGHYLNGDTYEADHAFPYADQDLQYKEYCYTDPDYYAGYSGGEENKSQTTSKPFAEYIDWDNMKWGVDGSEDMQKLTVVLPLKSGDAAQTWISNAKTKDCKTNGQGVKINVPGSGELTASEYLSFAYFSYSPAEHTGGRNFDNEYSGYYDFGEVRYPVYVVINGGNAAALATCMAVPHNPTVLTRKDRVRLYMMESSGDEYISLGVKGLSGYPYDFDNVPLEDMMKPDGTVEKKGVPDGSVLEVVPNTTGIKEMQYPYNALFHYTNASGESITIDSISDSSTGLITPGREGILSFIGHNGHIPSGSKLFSYTEDGTPYRIFKYRILPAWSESETDALGYHYFHEDASNEDLKAWASNFPPRVEEADLEYYVGPDALLDGSKYVLRTEQYTAAQSGFIKLTNPANAALPYLLPGDTAHPENQYDAELLVSEDLYKAFANGGKVNLGEDANLQFSYQFSNRKQFTYAEDEPKITIADENVLQIEKNGSGIGVYTIIANAVGDSTLSIELANGGYHAYTMTFPAVKVQEAGDVFLMIPKSSRIRETLTGLDMNIAFSSNITQNNTADTVFNAKLYKIEESDIGKDAVPENAQLLTVEGWGSFPSTAANPATHITVPGTALKEFRYATSDKSVAAVGKTGKITAKKKGSCVIYVYARNGLAKKVKVTVK